MARLPASDRRTSDTASPRTSVRAKALPLSLMHVRRVSAATAFAEVLRDEKEIVRASMLNVSRARVAQWMSVEQVDRSPAPLAVLYALDDEKFEQLVEHIRADRDAKAGGR